MKNIFVLAGKLESFGGMETHISKYCQQMAIDGASVTLVTTSTRLDPRLTQALARSGVALRQFDCVSGAFRKLAGYLSCLIFAFNSRSSNQLLYTHGRSGFAWIVGKVMRANLWIHHHHDDAIEEVFPKLTPSYQKVLQSVDWVIACTPAHAVNIDTYFGRNNRTIFLPYLKTEPVQNYPLPTPKSKSPIKVGYFGRMIEAKGVKTLLQLAPWFLANGIECDFYGTDTEGLMARGLPEGCIWHGTYNSETELDDLMSQIEILLLPTTFYEGLPIVICEAICRGVPVVAYDGGGLRDVKRMHAGVVVLSPDIEGFKSAILETSRNLSEPGFADSLQQFYFENFGNAKTLDWWKAVLAP